MISALKLKPDEIARFFSTLEPTYRTLINVRLKRIFGRDFYQLASERPDKIYDFLVRALGEQNTEVFFIMFSRWLINKSNDKFIN
ncbi:MAG: hypothetical protein ABWJ97_04795 [Thermoproteus sp.]